MATDVGLPAGFTLDGPSNGLPPGFALDQGSSSDRTMGQATLQETLAALHGAEREGLGIGNLPTQVGLPGVSDQTLQKFDREHAAEFANNKAGKFIGQALPLAAAQFIPGLDVAEDAAIPAIAGQAALGAIGGESTAPVGEQGRAALEGAALGGAGAGVGRALATHASQAAQRLQ